MIHLQSTNELNSINQTIHMNLIMYLLAISKVLIKKYNILIKNFTWFENVFNVSNYSKKLNFEHRVKFLETKSQPPMIHEFITWTNSQSRIILLLFFLKTSP